MRRTLAVTAALTLSVLAGFVPAAHAVPVTRSLTVSGTGVTSYPAFDPAVTRYAASTTAQTGGVLQIDATTSDPQGTVLVDGRPANGPTTVSGLSEGDEVSVIIADAGGSTGYAVVYLPADFPALTVTTHQPGLAPGYIGLGLTTFGAGAQFDTLIDRNGVPIWIHRGPGSDLKRQPNGDLTTFRPSTASGQTGWDLVTLDDQFNEVSRQHVLGGLTNTDNHDAEKLPDGSTILIGYEPRGPIGTGYLDATIQKIDSNGQVVFSWNSQGLEAETLNPLLWPMNTTDQRIDYAHINAVEEIGDGTHDLLVSFRHLSAIYRIATVARTGVAPGDVIWRLGGRHSDFTFVDDPDYGPCAQHSASMLPNGDVLLFDNGSGALGQSAAACVDHTDPLGPGIARLHTRIAEYHLDTAAHTATLVWSYAPVISDPDPRSPFAFFAGSARRLGNGDTLINWADERAMLATEIGPDSTLLWEVRTPDTGTHATRYASYRASLVPYTDAIDPTIGTAVPDDAGYVLGDAVRPAYSCTDRGGSNLQACTSDLIGGSVNTTTVGPHTWTVTATDGAGNTTTLVRHYTVRPGRQPDGMIRRVGSDTWRGSNVYGSAIGQTLYQHVRPGDSITSIWAVQNDGERSDSFRLAGTMNQLRWRARYFVGDTDVTRAVVAGTYRTPLLAPGAWTWMRVVVTPASGVPAGHFRTVRLSATSATVTTQVDRVAVRVTARR